MKSVLSTSFLTSVVFLLISCSSDNSGYPKTLDFDRNGGTKVVNGDGFSGHLKIKDNDAQTISTYYPLYVNQAADTIVVEEGKTLAYTFEKRKQNPPQIHVG